jgi:hypothetical protein
VLAHVRDRGPDRRPLAEVAGEPGGGVEGLPAVEAEQRQAALDPAVGLPVDEVHHVGRVLLVALGRVVEGAK